MKVCYFGTGFVDPADLAVRVGTSAGPEALLLCHAAVFGGFGARGGSAGFGGFGGFVRLRSGMERRAQMQGFGGRTCWRAAAAFAEGSRLGSAGRKRGLWDGNEGGMQR